MVSRGPWTEFCKRSHRVAAKDSLDTCGYEGVVVYFMRAWSGCRTCECRPRKAEPGTWILNWTVRASVGRCLGRCRSDVTGRPFQRAFVGSASEWRAVTVLQGLSGQAAP